MASSICVYYISLVNDYSKSGRSPLLIKHSNGISLLPTWRSKDTAVSYAKDHSITDIEIQELTMAVYDEAKEWNSKSGYELFLVIY